MGKPLTAVTGIAASEGFGLWAAEYDATPNALLALEMRLLSGHIEVRPGMRILDAGCGTGRWMTWLTSPGAQAFGIDSCHEMLLQAKAKPRLRGRVARADASCIPLRDNSVDLALCSFTLGYLTSPAKAFREMARVANQVIVSDLHPEAVRAGWTRSFRSGDRVFELRHFNHPAADLDRFASEAGLRPGWRMESSFGEPERWIFARAGKECAFEKTRGVPAVLIASWRKSSG